jgi:hypothetical protein
MHDQNFKNLILDYPRQALAFFAAEEVGHDLTQARITPVRQELLQERLGERFRELDVPLLVEWPDGRRAGLIFILEEETETYRFAIHRLAHYCLDMAELMQTQRIVPVVIFLRPGNRPDRLTLGGERQTYLDFRYLACDLYRLNALEHLDSDNLVIRLNLPNMAHPASARLDIYAAAQSGLATLETDPNRQSKYADFIDYYADLSTEELTRYTATYLTERGDLMGLAQQLRQEGRQEGHREGRQEGRREGIPQGEALILRRQLTRRFGPLPDWAEQALQAAPPERLEALADRILDADSLDSVFRP